ncbi:hypothetical protein [Nonomuraea endophytica]|uniref:Uncharacterized protein n=1 Tax=Nonomuraea endophytica TaxID=714136 RepID=A0A7W8EL80_9ACTN|nr:hypothetical protein [Nonomuraea endophytica]MBB5083604.1 hypothetical protein [Nonomuraea endophytica]
MGLWFVVMISIGSIIAIAMSVLLVRVVVHQIGDGELRMRRR